MSSVKIHVPPNKLGKLLRVPGGMAVADAVQKASAGLESLKTDCLADLNKVLEVAEACAAKAGVAYDPEVAGELYTIISTPIGVPSVCGMQSLDTCLTSLADLLDYLKGQQRWDANAVAVHLRAFRLLLHTEGAKDTAGAQAILEGLKKVSQRYARPSEG